MDTNEETLGILGLSKWPRTCAWRLQSTCVRPQEDSGHSLSAQLRFNVGLSSCYNEFYDVYNSTSTMFSIPG
ncbi:hypothetical protein Trydic_g2474 [Trypoxylus dichotomus]